MLDKLRKGLRDIYGYALLLSAAKLTEQMEEEQLEAIKARIDADRDKVDTDLENKAYEDMSRSKQV